MNAVTKTLIDIFYNGLEYFNRYYSEYRAFVVDNHDPKSMGRLRLVVPGIVDEPTDYWAPSIGTFSGRGYGTHVIPPNGSVVWVSFEFGNPDKPLWKHGYFGEGEIPKEYSSPNAYWFMSPKGHMVEINDDTDEITIKDVDSNTIIVTNKGISIIPRGKNKIYLGSKDKAEFSAVLGENLEKLLKPLIANQVGINKAITKLGSEVASKVSAIGNAAPTAPGIIAAVKIQALALGSEVASINSQVAESNDTINALLNQLPGIKSKKVKLDGK